MDNQKIILIFVQTKTNRYDTNRSNKIYIVFYGHPKQNMFAFYPPRTTKKESLEIAYQYYLTMVEDTDINEFTYGNVCWTDRGYPIIYRKVG